MKQQLEYFLRFFCPRQLYAYSTKVRIPQPTLDFRKLLIAKFLLKEGGVVIDGGAHIGYYTRLFAEAVGEKGRVYSFEPNPYLFCLLNKYASACNNIVAHQKALSNKNEPASFHVKPFLFNEDSMLGESREGWKKIAIETMCIDQLSFSQPLRLIKLDVEGHEWQAIQGAQGHIQHYLPWLIFEYVQTDERNDQQVILLLQEWGYQCMDIATLQWLPQLSDIPLTDVVAVPSHKMDQARTFLESLNFF